MKKILFSVILTLLFLLPSSLCKAGVPVYMDTKTGIMTFETYDKKASTNITWETVGFTVTRVSCLKGSTNNGGYPSRLPHGTLMLEPGWKTEKPQGNQVHVTFNIPKQAVSDALVKAGYTEIKENDIIYLHGIIQVWHGTNKYGSPWVSLPGISSAELWGSETKQDFRDRYDLEVEYHNPDPQPFKITYMYSTGEVFKSVSIPKSDWVKLGEKVKYTFEPWKKEHAGKTWYLSKSYFNNLKTGKRITGTTNYVTSLSDKYYPSQIPSVRTREKMQELGGLELVGVFRAKTAANSPHLEDSIDLPAEEPMPNGVIAADFRDNEQFDVTEGIPTTEDLYTNVFTSKYLLGYNFTRVYGTKSYNVEAQKTYTMTWAEKDSATGKYVTKTKTETVTKVVKIDREYSFWKITNLEYYKIGQAKINNYALPGSTVTLTPQNYTVPDLTYVHSAYMADHMIEPDISTVNLGSQSVSGKDVPTEEYTSQVDAKIKQIKVRNDSFVFDGQSVMNNNYVEKKTEEPVDPEIDYEEIEEDVLYKASLTIEQNKTNGTYATDGTVTYVPVKTMASRITNPVYPISGLTDVAIHTPTVCDASISNMASFNQMLYPDTIRCPLVLDTNFTVLLPTDGEHRYITGYGYKDYAKYIDRRQAQFPFDIYQGTTYYPAGTWIPLNSDITSFYLPIWVDEGKYTINFRSISINADANNSINQTETLANLSLSNYVATDTLNVEVSGRVYGLKLYDISDYPIWETIFRLPKSLKLSGFNYSVGINDQNGLSTLQNQLYTFPILNGSHPYVPDKGAIKAGYVTRFHVTTIGNMYSDDDYIRIQPKFYYVDKYGYNRQEVDLYYSETFLNKKQVLIKAGSDEDKENIKAYRLGDTYLSIPESEIIEKAQVTGKDLKHMKNERNNLFTFKNIMIPETFRTYIGKLEPSIKTIPAGVDPGKATKSKQKWYFEYYLPSEIHLAPLDYDLIGYIMANGGVDYHESFWLKDGYIIVNFEIETIQNRRRHLSYLNLYNELRGYCNMWKKEGFSYEKVDCFGNKFNFIDGDTFLYYTDQSAGKDYRSGGTH